MKEKALARGLSSSYLEGGAEYEDDDEDGGGVSLMAIKKQYKTSLKRRWGEGDGKMLVRAGKNDIGGRREE